jgi:hypothetical protein
VAWNDDITTVLGFGLAGSGGAVTVAGTGAVTEAVAGAVTEMVAGTVTVAATGTVGPGLVGLCAEAVSGMGKRQGRRETIPAGGAEMLGGALDLSVLRGSPVT